MNIKYITNVRIPTSRAQGYAIMKMCEEFSKLGNDVELIVPNRRNNEKEKDPFKFYGIENNFRITKIFSIDLLGPYEVFGKLFYWVDVISFLISLWFKTKFDNKIVYTRDYLVLLVVSKKNKNIFEVHDLPKRSYFFDLAIKKARYFIVLNRFIKNELVKRGINENDILISPSGVDIYAFKDLSTKEKLRKELKLPLNKKIVLYTGHLYDWKGVSTIAEVAKMMPEILFVFVGGVEPELTNFKIKYGNLPNVLVIEFQERKIIPSYLCSADVLILPNSLKERISKEYTSPLKLFEYMASGVPIVTSDLPSIREVLNEGNSVFALPDNPISFYKSISDILNNENLSNKISNQSKNDVLKYTWENRAKKIIEFIK